MTEDQKVSGSQDVTVMCLSFSGFSDDDQGSDPASTASFMGQCIMLANQVISLYGGKTDKYLGERIIAFFGLDRDSSRAPLLTIRAAFDVLQKFSELKSELVIPESFNIRIGIFSGEVFIAVLGAGTQLQENFFGESIRLASHICSLASSGQILVGAKCREQAMHNFDFQTLEPVPVKGYKKPVPVYAVSERKKETQLSSVQSGRIIISSLVGRKEEIAILEDSVKQLLNGRGGVVNIEGEAGIGKSRLMAELRASAMMSRVVLFEGRSYSEGKNLSFHPIIQIIKSWSGIIEADSPVAAYNKLQANITRIYPEQAKEIIPFVATMMGYPMDPEALVRIQGIEGEALERLILKNIRDLLARAADVVPVVLIVEDAHWADLSSVSFMESMFKLVRNHRLLFINIFRPGFKETGERLKLFLQENLADYYREMKLGNLNQEESSILISNLLNQSGLPEDIHQLILKRSEGNPFFIEEVIRSFIDEGLVEVRENAFIVTDKVQYANIPETIDKVILSRIDRLDEKTKGLLRTASVIGRNFYYKVLEEAAQTIEELGSRLQYLKETQLLSEHQSKEEVEFLFKHALAQQATYDSILQKTKKELHLKIARSIEKVFSDKLAGFYGVLAMHYEKAEVPEEMEKYLIKAGDEAFSSGASSEALNYYLKAIKNLQVNKLDEASLDRQRDIEIKIGFAHEAAGNNIEATECFTRIITTYYYHKNAFPTSQIRSAANTLFNMASFLFKLYFRSLYFRRQPGKEFDQYVKVLSQWGQALATYNPRRFFFQAFYFLKRLSNYDISSSVYGLSLFIECAPLFLWTGISLKISGKMLQQSKKLKAESHPVSLIHYRFTQKMQDYHLGIFEEDQDLENVFQTGMRIGEFWPTTIYIVYCGYVCIEKGNYQGFLAMLDKLKEIADSFDNSHAQAQFYRLSAAGNLKFRKLDQVFEATQNGIVYTKKTGHFTALLIIWCIKSQLHALRKEAEEARMAFAEADNLIHDKKIIPTYYVHYLQAKAYLEMLELELCIAQKKPVKHWRKAILETLKQLVRLSKTVPGSAIETWRIKGLLFRLMSEHRKALRCYVVSMQSGQRYNSTLELARTWFEAGKFLQTSDAKHKTILGFSGNEYLLRAKSHFMDMDLSWDLMKFGKEY